MTRLTIDSSLSEILPTLTQPVEFCDETGRVLGQYFPRPEPAENALEPQISREEIEQRKRSKDTTYTTAEVLARLEKL